VDGFNGTTGKRNDRNNVVRRVFCSSVYRLNEPEEFASAFSDEEIRQEKNFRSRMAANAAKK
jgi:hypothetical protein